nr:hypothetical protein [Actinomycetota bacterium]
EYGIYDAPDRLAGAPTLAILALASVVPIAIRLVSRLRGMRTELASRRAMLWAALANTLLLVLAFVMDSDRFVAAGAAWLQNLFIDGGWNLMWWFGAAVIIGVLLLPESLRRHPWGRMLAYAFFQFLGVAMLVHAVTHPGRVGWGDSLNRVTFHAVPLLFWLAAMLVSGTVSLVVRRSSSNASVAAAGDKRR